jgi:TatD DNase family protein
MHSFYDTHAHLHHRQFAADLGAVVQRAREAGVTRIINAGTDLETSRAAVALAEQHAEIFAAVGWHPCDVAEAPDDVRPALRELAAHPKVVAIGETGLDYYHLPKTDDGDDRLARRLKARQAAAFRQQLELAAELGLPVVVHQRNSMADTLAIAAEFVGRARCQFHCFVDDPATMRQVLALGGVVSFTGILTFKNSDLVRQSLAAAPPGSFLLETDSPYLAPPPHRGQRCEPAYVALTAATATEVRGCSLAELSAVTCTAAERFFPKLSPEPRG